MTQRFFEMAKTAFDAPIVKPRAIVLNIPNLVYCHEGAANTVRLTAEQCQDAVAGKVHPQGLSEEESGKRCHPDWREIVDIIHTIGGYRWIAHLEVYQRDHEGAAGRQEMHTGWGHRIDCRESGASSK
ncbi:hypothetical protein F4859DRAFT_508269 [Xylaria cf. heliscus]|nr:hypothetical protein F4859DRAFT_508269 [Xylaria cf. heliscus]